MKSSAKSAFKDPRRIDYWATEAAVQMSPNYEIASLLTYPSCYTIWGVVTDQTSSPPVRFRATPHSIFRLLDPRVDNLMTERPGLASLLESKAGTYHQKALKFRGTTY
ncbi:hypothetical protein WG66_005010 [Moniliophthora roreri]|nr:hypothetical protein WG66_005010 [Moniliophthora roreri]